jgi:hypothetical protein
MKQLTCPRISGIASARVQAKTSGTGGKRPTSADSSTARASYWGQIVGELDGDGLLLPVRAQLCPQRVGQHVDGRAGIQQTRGGGGAALKLQNEGEKGKQAGFASQAVSGGISEASTFSRRTSSQ